MNKKIISLSILAVLLLSTAFAAYSGSSAKALTVSTVAITCYNNPHYVNSTNPLYLNSNSTLTLIANVTGSSPTGTVTWSTNSSTGSFNSTSTTLTSGIAAVTYRDTQPGNVTITANYSGDSNNLPSSSTLGLALYNLDFNHDGTVNFLDTLYFVKNYIYCVTSNPYDHACDLNQDGTINFRDLVIYVSAYLGYAQTL